MRQESRKDWISVRDALPGFYNRVEIGRSLRGTNEVIEVFDGEFILTEFGHWSDVNSTNDPLNLHQVSYWRLAIPKVKRWIGRSRLTGHSKEFIAINRDLAWELANKWRRDNFMVEGELQLWEVTSDA